MSGFFKSGFTLTEIMIVIGIIGILAAMTLPNLAKARETTQKNACINNMRQIQAAKDQWAIENRKSSSDIATPDELKDYIKGGFPNCPTNGTYDIATVDSKVSCSKHGSL